MKIRSAKGIAIAFDRAVNQGPVGARKLFFKTAENKSSFLPLTEVEFLTKIRNKFPINNFIYARIDGILNDTDLSIENFAIETYN